MAAGADPAAEAADLVALMTPDERRWCLDGDLPFWAGLDDLGKGGYHRRTFPAAEVDRLGIPGFHFSDGPRGVVIGPATCFPVSMARGATWDLDLEERIGEAIGRELRAVGADLYGGVCVNVLRHPAWGRAQETYGEDPFHIGELGAALTRGVQRHAMACVKHFALNSMENARFSVDVTVDEQALHEVFLPHFKRIVDEGVACVMSAYNAVNGEWCGQSPQLLTEVLRDEWGFTGMVISDWIFGLRDAGPSVAAGLDVEMPYRMIRAGGLDQALAEGETDEADITAAVRHTVATLLRFAGGPRPARARRRRARLQRAPRAGARGGHQVHRAAPQRARRRHAGAPARRGRPRDASPSSVASPPSATSATVGRATCGRPTRSPRSTACAPRCPGPRSSTTTAPSRRPPPAWPSGATWPWWWSATPRADEGEFIGDSGTSHLQELLPGPDDPELVAAFAARVEAGPHTGHPRRSAPPAADGSALGFAQGGDRTSLRLHPDDEALIAAVVAANPRTVVAIVAGSAVVTEAWRQSVPAHRAVLVRRHGGRPRAGRRAPRPGRADRPPAVHRPHRRGAPAAVRPRRRRGHLRRLARLLAPRPRRATPRRSRSASGSATRSLALGDTSAEDR